MLLRDWRYRLEDMLKAIDEIKQFTRRPDATMCFAQTIEL